MQQAQGVKIIAGPARTGKSCGFSSGRFPFAIFPPRHATILIQTVILHLGKPENLMNKLLILLLVTTSFASCQEKYSGYKVIQFEGNKKQNSQVVKEVSLNENGQVQFEKYSGFKTSKYNSFVDVEITNFYKDTLLIETLKYYPNSFNADSARIEYTYNDKNQLIRGSILI